MRDLVRHDVGGQAGEDRLPGKIFRRNFAGAKITEKDSTHLRVIRTRYSPETRAAQAVAASVRCAGLRGNMSHPVR